eukprot:969207-Lingulodinium_polyedra.AAC.1
MAAPRAGAQRGVCPRLWTYGGRGFDGRFGPRRRLWHGWHGQHSAMECWVRPDCACNAGSRLR